MLRLQPEADFRLTVAAGASAAGLTAAAGALSEGEYAPLSHNRWLASIAETVVEVGPLPTGYSREVQGRMVFKRGSSPLTLSLQPVALSAAQAADFVDAAAGSLSPAAAAAEASSAVDSAAGSAAGAAAATASAAHGIVSLLSMPSRFSLTGKLTSAGSSAAVAGSAASQTAVNIALAAAEAQLAAQGVHLSGNTLLGQNGTKHSWVKPQNKQLLFRVHDSRLKQVGEVSAV